MNGMVCDIVSSNQELLDAFGKPGFSRCDLILMDIQMPVMSGYDAVRAIRAGRHPYTRIIPIIAMMVNVLAEDMKESANAGMSAHMPKSIDMRHLEVVITELVKKKQG